MGKIGFLFPLSETENMSDDDVVIVETFLKYFNSVADAEERFAIWAKMNIDSINPCGSKKEPYQKDANGFDKFFKTYNEPKQQNTKAFFEIYSKLGEFAQNFILKVFFKGMRISPYSNLSPEEPTN